MGGYIKLFRTLQSNEIWTGETFTDGQAWVDLLMLTNWEEGYIKKRGMRITIPRGYCGHSIKDLSIRWKWSRGKVYRYLEFMEHQNMLIMEHQKNHLTTLIKIINYDEYQGNGTSDRTSNGTQTDTSNKNRSKEDTNTSGSAVASPTYKKAVNPLAVQDFEVFWKEYPRKVGKGNALKAWLSKGAVLSVALESLKWFKNEEWKGKDSQYIPHASSWLNRGDGEATGHIVDDDPDGLAEIMASRGKNV
jgi:hypothetical protein